MVIAATHGGADFSRFVTFRIERGCVKERQEVLVMPGGVDPLVRQLIGLEVDMLIAAALHPELRLALEESGVGAIENIRFEPDQAVAAYLAGELFSN